MQPKLEVSSSPKHTLWKLEKTIFRLDAPGFEPTTLSIELAIDWHANPLSHHSSVKKYILCFPFFYYLIIKSLEVEKY